MTNYIRAAFVGGVVAVFAAGCASTRASVPGLHKTAEGVVQNTGQTQITVAGIENQPNPIRFNVGADTTIKRKGERFALQDLTPGTPVRIKYTSSTGAETAYEIEVLTGGEAAKVRTNAQQQGYGGAGQSGQSGSSKSNSGKSGSGY